MGDATKSCMQYSDIQPYLYTLSLQYMLDYWYNILFLYVSTIYILKKEKTFTVYK